MSEEVVWTGKPTVLAFYDGLLGGALLIVASVLLLGFPNMAWLSAAGIACGLLFIAFASIRARANTYVLTNRCVRRQYRFVAVKVDEAPLEKVTNTVVEQDIVGRIFGFGDLRFDTAGTGFAGVLFKGVKNPAEVKKIVDSELRTG